MVAEWVSVAWRGVLIDTVLSGFSKPGFVFSDVIQLPALADEEEQFENLQDVPEGERVDEEEIPGYVDHGTDSSSDESTNINHRDLLIDEILVLFESDSDDEDFEGFD